ncbi:hypothetical protein [Candidatus Liberibacter africanus]|uniref:DNA ligase, NAD-dependent n=1 Tax=Candidatus Liberibacter africanus PTSAPSY TaxID=1277257 RepID=A0A0G3I6G8_LIBAF|nr:hypothetical protein [Candidatus Liberibacter africanus]AKK20093.1 DNA ligase, NAD-dependent [Candidatus Liberibacter africanus PTSAPSY]
MGDLELGGQELEKLLNYEALFLPKPKTLSAILKKLRSIDEVSEIEARIECEYLIKICLHNQKWYYRLSDTPIEDWLYDQVFDRVDALMQKYPHIVPKDDPIYKAGY